MGGGKKRRGRTRVMRGAKEARLSVASCDRHLPRLLSPPGGRRPKRMTTETRDIKEKRKKKRFERMNDIYTGYCILIVFVFTTSSLCTPASAHFPVVAVFLLFLLPPPHGREIDR